MPIQASGFWRRSAILPNALVLEPRSWRVVALRDCYSASAQERGDSRSDQQRVSQIEFGHHLDLLSRFPHLTNVTMTGRFRVPDPMQLIWVRNVRALETGTNVDAA